VNADVFCRQLDVISRKQGMKGGSVPAHVTELSNAVDEESAPKGEQKKAKGAQAPLESCNMGRLSGINHSYFLLFFAAEWM
jgi:hypothetical protein